MNYIIPGLLTVRGCVKSIHLLSDIYAIKRRFWRRGRRWWRNVSGPASHGSFAHSQIFKVIYKFLG